MNIYNKLYPKRITVAKLKAWWSLFFLLVLWVYANTNKFKIISFWFLNNLFKIFFLMLNKKCKRNTRGLHKNDKNKTKGGRWDCKLCMLYMKRKTGAKHTNSCYPFIVYVRKVVTNYAVTNSVDNTSQIFLLFFIY